MPKPGADPSSGKSLGDALRLPKRHPACRRREAQPGSCTERENLAGDAKGKGASIANREAESTDAPARGGLLRSSEEAGVMPVERRKQAIAIWIGSTGNGRNPISNGRRQPSCGGTSRMTRECHVRICEGLGVQFPGPTRQTRSILDVRSRSGLPLLSRPAYVITAGRRSAITGLRARRQQLYMALGFSALGLRFRRHCTDRMLELIEHMRAADLIDEPSPL